VQLLITASKDTYITDKVISNSYRSKNSNVGHAATLDLFKLYEESGVLDGGNFITSDVTEKSVLLLKFDYSKVGALTSSILNIDDNSFKASLELTDISSGLQKPFNFSALCSPLINDFEEGFGVDVNEFNDLGSANFLTGSYFGSTPVLWKSEGANSGGGTGLVAATGTVTVARIDFNVNVSFILSDGTNTITFTAADAAGAVRVSGTNYTFGYQGVADVNALASRIYDAIVLAKTGIDSTSDLNITATNPAPGAVVNLTQDTKGFTGNTAITLNNIGDPVKLTAINFANGYDTNNLDYFTSGSISGTPIDLGATAYLSHPNDNMIFDVTNHLKAVLKNHITNNGFRIGFSGSYDTDNKTRFVKRLASRHVSNKHIAPKLRISFDDNLSDNSDSIFLDKATTLVLRTKKGIVSSNLFAAGAQLINDDCGKVNVSSGSYSQSANFSQVNRSSTNARLTGAYEASLTIPSNNSLIKEALAADSSGFYVTLKWISSDEAITFSTKKVKVRNIVTSIFDNSEVIVSFVNRKSEYFSKEDINIHVTAVINSFSYASSKIAQSPENFTGILYYRVLELVSSQEIIPWDFGDNQSTAMSSYGDVHKAVIKDGSLLANYSYILEVGSLVDESLIVFNSFTFKVS